MRPTLTRESYTYLSTVHQENLSKLPQKASYVLLELVSVQALYIGVITLSMGVVCARLCQTLYIGFMCHRLRDTCTCLITV